MMSSWTSGSTGTDERVMKASEVSNLKEVLFVSSYHEGQEWVRNMMGAVREEFRNAGCYVDFRVVSLDAKRIRNREVWRQTLLTQLNEVKGNLDLIIVSDPEANDVLFTLDHPLVKKVPIVFCSVGSFVRNPDFPNVTGVVSEVDYGRVYLLGRKMFPEAQRVYIVGDSTASGQFHLNLAHRQLKEYEGDFPIVFNENWGNTVDEFMENLRDIYPLSFIIFTTWQRDATGIYRDPEIYYPTFARVSPVPIFSGLDHGVGHGILGGYVVSSIKQGTIAGRMGVRILKGECVTDIPIDTLPLTAMFDDDVLRLWDIAHATLPANSEYLNLPASVWKTYKGFIIFGAISFVILFVLLLFLVYYQLRYRRMLHKSVKLENAASGMAEILEQKTELLLNTLSSMSEGIVVVDTNGRVIEINREAQENLGCGQEALGKRLEEVCQIGGVGNVFTLTKLVERVIRQGEEVFLSSDTILVPTDAPVQSVSGGIYPLRGVRSRVNGAVVVFRNVTQELQQQKFLHISTRTLKSYTWFYNIKDGKLEFGEGFVEIRKNPEDFDTLEKFAEHLHPEDRKGFLDLFREKCLFDSGDFSIVYRIDFLGNGDYRWWERRGEMEAIVTGDHRTEKYLYGMDIDVHEHTLEKERMAEAMKKAEESDRLKSAFLANMSHEIRTPLNGIVGFANLLIDEGYSPEEKVEFCETINFNSDILLRLLNDVLDLSRIETGASVLNFESCDLVALIHSTMDMNRMGMPTGVELREVCEFEKLIIRTDTLRVTQLLTNLIGNAKKFTKQGSILVGFSVLSEENEVKCWVKDTGVGIDKEQAKHVFERFYKVDQFQQGTGLGLPICKAIVELLGGKIGLESEVGIGSTFYFTLPFDPIAT